MVVLTCVWMKFLFQDRSSFFGNGSAFSDLYNVSTGRSQDSIPDSASRLRDNNELDIKRTGKQNTCFYSCF